MNKDYGTDKFRPKWNLVKAILITIFLSVLLLLLWMPIYFGGKVNGNPDRIAIQDTIDLLTPEEEQNTLDLFQTVYETSGMPVTLYTDDMEWKSKYNAAEFYAEELYYAMGIEEDAMLILFTYDGTFEWEYEMYCGDDTMQCLPDDLFDELADNFQKGMAGQKIYDALDFSFHSIMDELGKEQLSEEMLFWNIFLGGMYGLIVFGLFSNYLDENRAYKYFKENPNKLDDRQMSVLYECPSCGAPNSNLTEICEYCGAVLKLESGSEQ